MRPLGVRWLALGAVGVTLAAMAQQQPQPAASAPAQQPQPQAQPRPPQAQPQEGASLPDLKRGQAAAAAGDIAGAERDLVPLAERGYLQAQVALGGLYAQAESPDTVRKAIHWYRIAADQDDKYKVPLARALMKLDDPATFTEAERFLREADKNGDPRALAGLLEFYTDHPERDPKKQVAALVGRAEKSDDADVEGALLRWYRKNLQLPDAGRKLAARCEKALDRVPDCFVDLARHDRANAKKGALKDLAAAARKRYDKGTLAAPLVERAAWSMVADSIPGEPAPELAYPLLKQIMNTSLSAQVRVARLQVEYTFLDPTANPEKVLAAAAAQGSDEAALALGRLYLAGTRTPADPDKAKQYFEQAGKTQPAAHYFLGRMYKRGELGEADPVRAAVHLLTAARGGYARADYLLAELFSDARGARINRANAYVFATLAARSGIAEGPVLLQQLQASMTPQERQQGDQLFAAEAAARAPAGSPLYPTAAALSGGNP